MLNWCVYTKPAVDAFAIPESHMSPVPRQAALEGPPGGATPAWEVVVWKVDFMVHRTASPAVIVVMAVAPIPPVLLVQSTNPTSDVPNTAQPSAAFASPIFTSNVAPRGRLVLVVLVLVVVVWPSSVVLVVVVVVVVVGQEGHGGMTFTCPYIVVE